MRLVATDLRSRLKSAAATPNRFDVAAGRSERIAIKPPLGLVSILRTRGKAIGKVIASMPTSGGTAIVTRLITVTPERKRK